MVDDSDFIMKDVQVGLVAVNPLDENGLVVETEG
jgi:hypothetical protein